MSNTVSHKSISHLSPIIHEIVNSGGSVRLEVKGSSMMPFLRSEKDSVLLKKADNIKKYDVVLFKKHTGKIALHRIVHIDNGVYKIVGDNQYKFDRDITKEDLIAKAVEYHRGKLRIGEAKIRTLGMLWFATYPLRNFLRRGFGWIKRHSFACIRYLKNKFR